MTLAQHLLLPAFVHVALVLSLLVRTGSARVGAVRSGQVKIKDIRSDNTKWPEPLQLISNNYANQFELPVLFYALLGFLLIAGLSDTVQIVLAWAFVASRLVHSVIHTGSNDIRQRFRAFLAGVAILTAMWAWFGLRFYVLG